MKWAILFLMLGGIYAKDAVDFKNIRQILENDRLSSEMKRQKKAAAQKKQRDKLKKIKQYQIPNENEFWSFFSEYWIVKNAPQLKWNFKRPDYGLKNSFRRFLEQLGIYEKKFKILFVNTPELSHMALPSGDGEIIFLLSNPFVRALNLSTQEMNLLLLENYLRAKRGYFKGHIKDPKLTKWLGGNFFGKKLDQNLLKNIAKKYSHVIFEKGFSFQQQFQVTSEMSTLLKPYPQYWNSYYQMIGKIDHLVRSNILYKKYPRIYPSPEIQRGWLRPKM